MADEELVVRARVRDELSRPLRNIADETRKVGRQQRGVQRESRQLGGALTRMRRRMVTVGTAAMALARRFDRAAMAAGRLALRVGRGLARAARMGALAIAGLGVAVIAVGVKLAGMASDAEETLSKFNTVFGDTAEATEKWVQDTNRAFGIAKTELRDMTAAFGVFGQAAGFEGEELSKFSTRLGEVALDLASFHNEAPDQVAQALRSGLAGESEPLKRFGIIMSQASLDAFALSEGIGKTTKEMTEQEKVALRQAFIMANLGAAEGDMARTADSTANRVRKLKGRLQDMGEEIGERLTPYMGVFAGLLGEALPYATHKITGALDRFLPSAEDVEARIRGMVDRGWDLYNAFQGAEGGADGLRAMIAELTGDSDDALSTFDSVHAVLDDVWVVIRDLLIPAFRDAGDTLPIFLTPLGGLRKLLAFVADNAETLVPILSGLFTSMMAFRAVTAVVQGLTAAQWALNAAMTANPFGIVVVALAGLTAAFIAAYRQSETFRRIANEAFITVAETGVSMLGWLVDKWLLYAELIVGAAAKAWGWIPGIGPQLRQAHRDVRTFRDGTNAVLNTIKSNIRIKIDQEELNRQINATNETIKRLDTKDRSIAVRYAVSGAGISGDGPGAPIGPGGRAMDRAARLASGLPLRMSSGYRSPARNRAAGGSPTSFHMDRRNPASDWVGPTWALDEFAARLRRDGPWRELLWRVPNHAPGDNPHVHVAHQGGWVSPSWPTLPGLRRNERPAILEIGEKVVAKAQARGMGDGPGRVAAATAPVTARTVQSGTVVVRGPLVHVDGGNVDAADLAERVRRELEKLERNAQERR